MLRFVEALRSRWATPRWPRAIVGEPTDLRVVVAHKGCLRTRIPTLGRAAHSSRPERASTPSSTWPGSSTPSATSRQSLAGGAHPLVGSPTLSVGQDLGRDGGEHRPRALHGRDRPAPIPGEDAARALAELDDLLAGRRERRTWPIEREEPSVADWALDTPPDAAVVGRPSAACRASACRRRRPGSPTARTPASCRPWPACRASSSARGHRPGPHRGRVRAPRPARGGGRALRPARPSPGRRGR